MSKRPTPPAEYERDLAADTREFARMGFPPVEAAAMASLTAPMGPLLQAAKPKRRSARAKRRGAL